MEGGYHGQVVYGMGPRVPDLSKRGEPQLETSTFGFKVPSRILSARAESTECTDPTGRLCEKPIGSSSMTLPIALGVCIPLFGAIGLLVYLHRRGVKKQRLEDAHDPHKSLDFGLGANPGASGGRKEKGGPGGFQRQRGNQMSMDMNLSSPYLLPPEVHNSRESLNSLARSIKQSEDPYGPVNQYTQSDAGSIRSFPKGTGDGVSVYNRSASKQDGVPMSPGPYSPSRQSSFPRSPLSPEHSRPPQSPLPQIPKAAQKPPQISTGPQHLSMQGSLGWDDESIATGIQEPAPVAQKDARMPPAQLKTADPGVELSPPVNPFEKPHAQEIGTPTETTSIGLGLSGPNERKQAPDSPQSASSSVHSSRRSSIVEVKDKVNSGPAPPTIEIPKDYYDFNFADVPQTARPASPDARKPQLDVEDEPRGRNMQRTSHLYGQQEAAAGGLGVPNQDNRRLSVGFRPLPPSEITETEDPEHRANRIRSFYKEYFEDLTNPEERPPMPQMPPQHQQQNRRGPPQQHYDAGYGPDAAYYDPTSNSFVMPYAQPVSRRAMTPPPSGQRFPGPRGPPGPRMPGPPGIRGPPRPGSSVSNQIGGPSRPGSSASGAYGRPRAGSAMSGRPRAPLPPPMDLHTLPTPSKLSDDSFSILNAADFAPPENFAARARGRSQSPAGERRPYHMKVPAHSPLVNTYDELPALPSPHLLRKSTTFTALDFAPPRKFANDDSRSDAGSIRSNKSGLSQVHAAAIRGGAGRVSRLPGDQVFTSASLADSLKPSWGLRDT
ncbi:hypothetical protein QBC44DRAFT_78671 [Cladorrhinum sp. PSN332]|nr:hypothetical protein QBC44DRAFT_78671 [Cladorrhinum sp. PSN332]